jgi:hypothetical protein
MIRVHFVEFELELHGLDLLLVNIVLLLISILIRIALGGQSLN